MRPIFVVLFALLAIATSAQTPAPAQGATPGGQVFRFAGASLTEYAALYAPFSCDVVQDLVKTTADGARITTQRQTHHLYRDSQGRVRREQPIFGGARQLVVISDLVSGYEYVLDPDHSAAHRTAVKAAAAKAAREVYEGRLQRVLAAPAGATKPAVLGNRMIDGVYAEGLGYTTPIPAGALGNDRPLVIAQERWVAPDLALCLLDKRTDPREGETTIRMIDIKRAEPDPGLFQIPANYAIVEESGPFQVVFVRPRQTPPAK